MVQTGHIIVETYWSHKLENAIGETVAGKRNPSKVQNQRLAEDKARRLHKPGQAHARPNSLAPRGGSKNSGRVRLARADPGPQESDYWEPGVAKALAVVAPGDQKGSPNFSHEGLGGTAGPKPAHNLVPLSPTMCVSSSRGDQSRKKERIR